MLQVIQKRWRRWGRSFKNRRAAKPVRATSQRTKSSAFSRVRDALSQWRYVDLLGPFRKRFARWGRRIKAFRRKLVGWRYPLFLAVTAIAVLGAGYGGYKAWRHSQLRAQSLALVDGRQITIFDVEAEAAAEGIDPARLDAAAKKRLLERVIDRRLLVAAAVKQGLAEDDRLKAVRARADEMVPTGLMAQRLAGKPPVISEAEARRFMAAHPAKFAARQTFVIDAITCDGDSLPAAERERIDTMDDAEAYLKSAKSPYRRATQPMDSANMADAVVSGLTGLAPGQVFILPQGEKRVVGTVERRMPNPAPDGIQLAAAQDAVQQQKMKERFDRALVALKAKAKIEYSNK